MRFAISKDGKELGWQKIVPTPVDDFEEGMRQFQTIAKELTEEGTIEAVAGGVAGTLNKEHSLLLHSPHMPGWVDQPLKKRIEELFRVSVYLENDAALAGLGEAIAGAGRGYSIAGYVTVSTGVGGVRIVDGAIDRNVSGFEIGHQIINYDGETRTLEEYVSGSGFLQRFGKKPEEVSDPAVWEEVARVLAVGLRNTILHWSPEVLVLGGPMVLQSPFSFGEFLKHFEKSLLEVFLTVPEIKKAELEDRGGLEGALVYLRQQK